MHQCNDGTMSAVSFGSLETFEAVLMMHFSRHYTVLNICCVARGYSFMGLLCPLIFFNLAAVVINCKWEFKLGLF